MDFMSVRKGMIFNKPKTDFEFRYVVVDYDYSYVYCIDLNDENKQFRRVLKFTYEYINTVLILE